MNSPAPDLIATIEAQLSSISDGKAVEFIRGRLIKPIMVLRAWEWSKPSKTFPSWTVLEDPRNDLGIAYSADGFGPKNPWGLIALSNEKAGPSYGMDSSWYPTFLDAFFESLSATDLPIWRIYKKSADDGKGTKGLPISQELEWDEAWSRIHQLRESDPTSSYDAGQNLFLHNWELTIQ